MIWTTTKSATWSQNVSAQPLPNTNSNNNNNVKN
jgi:hypothetical protein